MEKGKRLTDSNMRMYSMEFMDFYAGSPYIPMDKIGFDFNYNKFTKHGIELRLLDSFPEEYLESVVNLLILVCEYATRVMIPDINESNLWDVLAVKSLQWGSHLSIFPMVYNEVFSVFGMSSVTCLPFQYNKSPIQILQMIADDLYGRYKMGPVCTKLSPNMKPVNVVDYNSILKAKHKASILL
jgi:hypothetical protein